MTSNAIRLWKVDSCSSLVRSAAAIVNLTARTIQWSRLEKSALISSSSSSVRQLVAPSTNGVLNGKQRKWEKVAISIDNQKQYELTEGTPHPKYVPCLTKYCLSEVGYDDLSLHPLTMMIQHLILQRKRQSCSSKRSNTITFYVYALVISSPNVGMLVDLQDPFRGRDEINSWILLCSACST